MKIEFHQGPNTYDQTVLWDGVDISSFVRGIEILAEVGNITRIKLDIVPEEVKISCDDNSGLALQIVSSLREEMKRMEELIELDRRTEELITRGLSAEEMRQAFEGK